MHARAEDRSQTVARASLSAVLLSLLSCAGETVLHQETSEYQEVWVTENWRGLRTLKFSRRGAVQSLVEPGRPEALHLPYVETSMVGLAFPEPALQPGQGSPSATPRRALVVGLGGGSIPAYLLEAFPNVQIDAVEIDPVVADVAQTWFGLGPHPRLTVHVDDGRHFVETTQNRYDLVFLDAYGGSAAGDAVPLPLTTHTFHAAVCELLRPGGAVVANVWGGGNPLYGSMVRTIRSVYPQVHVFPVSRRTNRIVVARADSEGTPRNEIETRLASLELQLPGKLTLTPLLRKASLRVQIEDLPPGEILRDATAPTRHP